MLLYPRGEDMLRKQSIILLKASNIHKHDIPTYVFYDNSVIIVYDQFTHDLFKYIYVRNVFLVPRELYEKHKHDIFEIDSEKIITADHILTISCDYDGQLYLPEEAASSIKIEKYKEWFKHTVRAYPYETWNDLIPYIVNIPTTSTSYNNVDARFDRLFDFGKPKLAKKLTKLFYDNLDAFKNVETLSIQSHDFSTNNLDIKIKLDRSVYIYDPEGYHSYIDTITKQYFCGELDDLTFMKLLGRHPIPVVVFGILNYHLVMNVNNRTNRYNKIYNILTKRLETLCQKSNK